MDGTCGLLMRRRNSIIGQLNQIALCIAFDTGRLVMLFYRYMLPCVTTEAYSWADPENRNSGFKTGENSRLS